MDGYAVVHDDLAEVPPDNPVRLQVLETIAAGDVPKLWLVSSGHCAKIMTGAVVPRLMLSSMRERQRPR